jgi:hypothetical protein
VIALQADKSAMQREIHLLREMLEKATADRDELLTPIARAEMKLELYEERRLQPPKLKQK